MTVAPPPETRFAVRSLSSGPVEPHSFLSLDGTRTKIEEWCRDYSEIWPYTARRYDATADETPALLSKWTAFE
jgi:hypothetical protein